MKLLSKRWVVLGLGGAVGAALGWVYWYFYGCQDACTIRSSARNMSLYGVVMGGLLADMIRDFMRKKSSK